MPTILIIRPARPKSPVWKDLPTSLTLIVRALSAASIHQQPASYTFWNAGDDATELWLNADDNPANAMKIGYNTQVVSPRNWEQSTNQESTPRMLVGGQRYFIMALHKECYVSDHIANRHFPNSRNSKHLRNYRKKLTERAGFEPAVRQAAHTLSKRAPSATRTPLHKSLLVARDSLLEIFCSAFLKELC
jgi:hypothetical protein